MTTCTCTTIGSLKIEGMEVGGPLNAKEGK